MSKDKLEQFKKAYGKLASLLLIEEADEIVRDATIQRFEFTYELCWKTLKRYLEELGVGIFNTPRDVFKEAFRAELIQDGDIYIRMLRDRNLTTYTYDEEVSVGIYNNIKNSYNIIFKKLIEKLESL